MTTILYRAKNDKDGNARLILTIYESGRITQRVNVSRPAPVEVLDLPLFPDDVVDITPQQFARMARVAKNVNTVEWWGVRLCES